MIFSKQQNVSFSPKLQKKVMGECAYKLGSENLVEFYNIQLYTYVHGHEGVATYPFTGKPVRGFELIF